MEKQVVAALLAAAALYCAIDDFGDVMSALCAAWLMHLIHRNHLPIRYGVWRAKCYWRHMCQPATVRACAPATRPVMTFPELVE